MSNKLSPENLQKLLKGETITFQTELKSRRTYPIQIECYILPTDSDRKWVLVTAVGGKFEVGFIDARYLPEPQRAIIDVPHLVRSGVYDGPHSEIRYQAKEKGLFVVSTERQRKVGQAIFEALRDILVGMGAQTISFEKTSEKARRFYERNGGRPTDEGYEIRLYPDPAEELRFQMSLDSLTPEQLELMFIFVDSDVDGASRAWFEAISHTPTEIENLLQLLVAKGLVTIGEEQAENTWYKLSDPQFYYWLNRKLRDL